MAGRVWISICTRWRPTGIGYRARAVPEANLLLASHLQNVPDDPTVERRIPAPELVHQAARAPRGVRLAETPHGRLYAGERYDLRWWGTELRSVNAVRWTHRCTVFVPT